MKKISIIVFLCMSVFVLYSCEFSKWDNYEELAGEWRCTLPFLQASKFIFYEDGTCIVENVPIRETDSWGNDLYTLKWYGNEKTEKNVQSMDKWNFHGYWKVKEDTLYGSISKRPYYRYRIRMSPHLEMLETEQVCDSFINHTNVDDAFLASIDAWTISLFPPARLQYLSFYTTDPDNDFCYSKQYNYHK